MKRRKHGGFVAFTLTERERARVSRLARQLGFAHLDPLSHEIFQIGLATVDECYAAATRIETFQARRARVTRAGHG